MHYQDLVFALLFSGAFAVPGALKERSESIPDTPTTTAAPSATADACLANCEAVRYACKSIPSNSRPDCEINFNACIGYSPYDSQGIYVTPTACSTPAAATPTASCDSACKDSYHACRLTTTIAISLCESDYSSCRRTACSESTPSATSIPGGCNPAHPGSCPTPNPSAPAPAPTAHQTTWTVKNLSRYCGVGDTGCDYNFVISFDDGTADQACTVIRSATNASTESWYGNQCTTGSQFYISWGFSNQFGAGNEFAVMTITNNEKRQSAYFGVAHILSQPVTAGNPAGSGTFGDIGPQPVYSF